MPLTDSSSPSNRPPPPGTLPENGDAAQAAAQPPQQLTVSSVLGEMVWLFTQSPSHKYLFMADLEWGHAGLTELRVVENMRTRKHMMLTESDGVVALPGGSGTLEELLEALTLKRLGLYTNPIVLVNTRNYFEPLVRLFEHAVAERFMDRRHLDMWQVVDSPENVPAALAHAPPWSSAAREFAAVS